MKIAAVGATALVRSYTSTARATTPTASPISLTVYVVSRRPKGRTLSGAKRLPVTGRTLPLSPALRPVDECPAHTRAYAGVWRQVGSLTCRLQEGRDETSRPHSCGCHRSAGSCCVRHHPALAFQRLATAGSGRSPPGALHRERRDDSGGA